MLDVEKRYFVKPWVVHYNTKTTRTRLLNTRLPSIKQPTEQNVPIKHSSIHQLKRSISTVLPAITRNTSNNAASITTDTGTPSPPPPTMAYNTAVHEAAQRFMLRNNMAKFAQDSSSSHVTHSFYPRRTTLYDHIPAKIDTGLQRADSKEPPEPAHQLEPTRPVNWSALKTEIEQDIYIRAHTNRIQFNTGTKYVTQLTILGNLIRTKIKSHLQSATGSGDERYKIIVHLTIFPATAGGLHVASRCLWNTLTDNSITMKMQGIDCDILVVAFLCYTDLGRL